MHELDRKGVRGVYVQHARDVEVDVCVYYLHGELGVSGGGGGVDGAIADVVDVEQVVGSRWGRHISTSSIWWLGPLH